MDSQVSKWELVSNEDQGGRDICRLRGRLTSGTLSDASILRFKNSHCPISHPDPVTPWPLLAPWTLQGTPAS